MVSYNSVHNGPVMSAAKKALETGKAHHILIWIPEASENTLKNLLEKACCERRIQTDGYDHIIDWYFATVRRFHSVGYGPRNLNISLKTLEEKTIISLVERACESGNFEEIAMVIPDIPAGELRQQFNDVMKKRNYDVENIAAGRVYVSEFTDFIAFVNRSRSGSL